MQVDRSIDRGRLDLLRGAGFGDVEHDSHVPFMSHLVGVHRILRRWGCRDDVCDAGLFHSVYGTEYFEPDEGTVERRHVRDVIGERAERLAWLWCTIARQTIDPSARSALDRATGSSIAMTSDEIADIATLWAADTVEQIERMSAAEHGFAHGLAAIEHLAVPEARGALGSLPATARASLARSA